MTFKYVWLKDMIVNKKQDMVFENQDKMAHIMLHKYFSKAGSFLTHLTMMHPKGKWVMKSRDDLEEFFSKYTRAMKKRKIMSFLEVQQEYAPIIVDVDFKEKCDDIKPLYTQDTILEVHNAYLSILKKIYNISNKNMDCVVLTKDPYLKTEKNGSSTLKHGFHLHFPRIWMNLDMRKNILKIAQQNTSIELDDITTKGWLLYGSYKDRNSGTYKVDFCLNKDRKVFDMSNFLKDHLCLNVISEKPFTPTEDNIPQVLSVISYISHPSYHFNNFSTNVEVEVETPLTLPEERVYSEDDKNDLELMVKGLSRTFSEEYKSWMLVLQVIRNVFGDDDKGIEIAHKFSRKCTEKYDEQEVDKLYNRMTPNDYNIGIVFNMLKKSQPK